jgi:preprotein translocase subunit SecG
MITLLTVFHVIVCIFLVLVVLLQQGKSADWSGAFGGGGTQSTFGTRGSGTVLGKATTAAAVIFMITSLALAVLISQSGGTSVIREGARTNQPAAPAQPAGQPPAGQAPAPATPAPQSAPAPAQPPAPPSK